jgi:YjbE family integral membrane protein
VAGVFPLAPNESGGGMDLRVLAAGIGIILVDLALSADNALVIGAVAARLPRTQQRLAIIWGGFGALILRFALAVAATELLQLPYLRAIGALVILVIAVRMLLPESTETRFGRRQHERLFPAIVTITIADLAMSLDNVLAVGALAAGNILLLAGGLTISVALLFVASALVAMLANRLSWILDLAALILGWTAAELFIGDPFIEHLYHLTNQQQSLVYLVCLLVVIVADLFIRARARRQHRRASPGHASTAAAPTDASDAAAAAEPRSLTDAHSRPKNMR